MTILGIETSCDETAAAVVRDGREVLSNVVYTQIPLHRPYGGVVPEVASRAHVEKIRPVVAEAMERAGGRIGAVAVTYGPGLAPALIVGVCAAKGLAKALGVPLVGVNHVEAHLHAPFLFDAGGGAAAVPDPDAVFPALGLVVSGGNTVWAHLPRPGVYEVLGETLDDAAGEAFDKAAKLLGLGYPGGRVIDRLAADWRAAGGADGDLVPFPKGRPREGVSALAGLPADLCVSFSGLKTALLRHVQAHPGALDVPLLAASYQEAIAQALADRTRAALRRRPCRALVLGGGVSLNSRIRAVLAAVCADAGVPLVAAAPKYTGDNGAMVAGLAFTRGVRGAAAWTLDAAPSLEIGG